jgi:hypothetical protein
MSDTDETLRPINKDQAKNDRQDDWKKTNETWEHMVAFRNRIREVIYGTGSKKAVIAYGPPGIAKSTGVNEELAAYYHKMHDAWVNTDPDMREQAFPGMTITEAFGVQKFREPFIKIPGRASARRIYMYLCDYSRPGWIVVMDDLSHNPEIQHLIHQATDKENNYLITWDTSKDIAFTDDAGNLRYYDRRCNFHGSLIIVNNVKKDSIEMAKKYSDALRDRALEIFFPWNRNDQGVYIDRLAFFKDDHGEIGLLRFLRKPRPNGMGYSTMTAKEAFPILKDVRAYFIAHLDEIKTLSFRMLEDLVSDRINYGAEAWIEMAKHTIKK